MNTLEIRSTLEDLIELTRGSLDGLDEQQRIPRVDLRDILADFWDEWFNPLLEVWTPEVRSELRGVLLHEMRSHPADLVVRYADLAIYTGLIEYLTSLDPFEKPQAPSIGPFRGEPVSIPSITPSMHGLVVCVQELEVPSWEPHVALLQEDLRCILRDLAIEDINGSRLLTWEISNAGLAEDWERMFCLFERAHELGIVGEAEVKLARAQFHYFRAFRQMLDELWQTLMFQYECIPTGGHPLNPADWDTIIHNSVEYHSSRFLLASGLLVDPANAEDLEPARELLQEAIDALESAMKSNELPAPHKAALARCYFGQRRFRDAATIYEALLTHELKGAWSPFLSHIYRAAATSYQLGGNPQRAITTLQACTARFPGEADVYDKTAQLQAQEADFSGLQDTMRAKVENIPSADTDWRMSALLTISEVRRSDLGADGTVRPIDPAIHDGIVRCLNDYWPPFAQLSEKAQDPWVSGTYLRSFVPAQHEMTSKLDIIVIHTFLKALDLELGHRVFRPVREHFWRSKELSKKLDIARTRASAPKNLELLCNFLHTGRWNLSIGQKAALVSACRAPSHDLLKAMKAWLEEHFPALLAKSNELERVAKFRNAAEHEDKMIEPVEFIYGSCRSLMQCLI